jgi:hypothetical protein
VLIQARSVLAVRHRSMARNCRASRRSSRAFGQNRTNAYRYLICAVE